MLEKLRHLLKVWNTPDEDPIVTLVQVAIEDKAVGAPLAALLSLPHADRCEKIKQWQTELHAEGAPKKLIDILTRLEDETLANQTFLILQKAAHSKSAD